MKLSIQTRLNRAFKMRSLKRLWSLTICRGAEKLQRNDPLPSQDMVTALMQHTILDSLVIPITSREEEVMIMELEASWMRTLLNALMRRLPAAFWLEKSFPLPPWSAPEVWFRRSLKAESLWHLMSQGHPMRIKTPWARLARSDPRAQYIWAE